jgi:hypothetical protein
MSSNVVRCVAIVICDSIMLENIKNNLPTLVIVHAVNPVGFAKNRRVNEDNIDLNRYSNSKMPVDVTSTLNLVVLFGQKFLDR